MQTSFTPEQLKDPHLKEVDRILRRCVHCGFCTATCSTYVLLGDERDSPRGRIYLMKDMFENDRRATPEVKHHVDRCLSCLSCMTTCPSGVDYMHLVDLARNHIEETGKRSLRERFIRQLLALTLPYPRRFRAALALAPLGRPFASLFSAVGLPEIGAMLKLAPRQSRGRPRFGGPGTAATSSQKKGRVILLAGCAQQVLRPAINDATIRLLARSGYDVEVANGSGCCGALVHHMGREEQAQQFAKVNVEAWSRLIEQTDGKGKIDAIIINASGCGTTVKDYGYMLRGEPDYAERAKRVSALTKDITEFLAGADLGPPKRWSSLKVAYHAACSLEHGQRVVDEPKMLLRRAGFSLAEVPEGHICCGSAGTYNILQPELAQQLRARKIANIESTRADLVAAGNIGCLQQLESGLGIPIVHTVELLDWAYGGPPPYGLEAFERFAGRVPDAGAEADHQRA